MNELTDLVYDAFPSNSEYIKGECYLNWSLSRDTCANNFSVECDNIDPTLIVAANASKNEMILIDGTVIVDMTFVIRPMTHDWKHKKYGIGSSKSKNGINISIINYNNETEEEPKTEE